MRAFTWVQPSNSDNALGQIDVSRRFSSHMTLNRSWKFNITTWSGNQSIIWCPASPVQCVWRWKHVPSIYCTLIKETWSKVAIAHCAPHFNGFSLDFDKFFAVAEFAAIYHFGRATARKCFSLHHPMDGQSSNMDSKYKHVLNSAIRLGTIFEWTTKLSLLNKYETRFMKCRTFHASINGCDISFSSSALCLIAIAC